MYEVREWVISGVLTGYRVVKGSGWDMEIAAGFPFDMYIEGSQQVAKAKAERRCKIINGDYA